MEASLSSQLTIPIVIFFVSLFIRAVFSFLETTITALRIFKLKELALATGKYQNIFHALEKRPHRVIITILVVSSFADVVCAAIATNIMETIFSHYNFSTGLGFTLGVGISGSMIIVFGEIVPKNLARARGERMFNSLLWLINGAYYGLYPLITVLTRFSDILIKGTSGKNTSEKGGEWASSEKEIRFLIDYIHDKGIMETEKTEMLRSIFDLGLTPVKDIMVPATDIISVSIDTPIKDVLATFAEHQFTRMPVYKGSMENILGMVHQKDIFLMLSQKEDKPLKDILRPLLFAPETLKINQLLREFREQHMHIALVLNEHGSIIGLITLEDVLEEIVGDITDEHEPSAQKILKLQQGGWLVDASVPLEDLEKELTIKFKAESSITLGGFLTEQLQHLPKKGERVLYKKYYFQIQKASTTRVQQVLIFEEKTDA